MRDSRPREMVRGYAGGSRGARNPARLSAMRACPLLIGMDAVGDGSSRARRRLRPAGIPGWEACASRPGRGRSLEVGCVFRAVIRRHLQAGQDHLPIPSPGRRRWPPPRCSGSPPPSRPAARRWSRARARPDRAWPWRTISGGARRWRKCCRWNRRSRPRGHPPALVAQPRLELGRKGVLLLHPVAFREAVPEDEDPVFRRLRAARARTARHDIQPSTARRPERLRIFRDTLE